MLPRPPAQGIKHGNINTWTNWNLLALQRLLTVQCGVNLLFGISLGQNSPTVASHYIQLPSDLETNQLTHCHLLQRSTLFFQSQMKPAILRFAVKNGGEDSIQKWVGKHLQMKKWQTWHDKKTMVTFRSCGMRYQIAWIFRIPSEDCPVESR